MSAPADHHCLKPVHCAVCWRGDVEAAIQVLVAQGSYSWPDVMDAVSGSAPEDWLKVRGIMQGVNYENGFARTANLYEEVYGLTAV